MPALASDRRQLLRAGAWALPVVAVAAAAPAFASSLRANMSTSSGPAPPPTPPPPAFTKSGTGNNNYIDGSLVLRNTGGAMTTALTITVTVSDGVSQTAAGHVPPTGWTTQIVPGTTTKVRFVAPVPAGQIAGPTGQQPVVFRVKRLANGNSTASVDALIDPGNGTTGLVARTV